MRGGAWGANGMMHEGGMHNMRPVCMAVGLSAVGLMILPAAASKS